MNETYLHLLLNHFPIFGTLFGLVVLLYGMVRKENVAQKIALITFTVCAIITLPVFLSGEPAEETVENIPGVLEVTIEAHEEAAEIGLWFMEILGLFSLFTFFTKIKGYSWAARLLFFTFILSLFSFSLLVYVGHLGGKIRHTELVTGADGDGTNRSRDNEDDE